MHGDAFWGHEVSDAVKKAVSGARNIEKDLDMEGWKLCEEMAADLLDYLRAAEREEKDGNNE